MWYPDPVKKGALVPAMRYVDRGKDQAVRLISLSRAIPQIGAFKLTIPITVP